MIQVCSSGWNSPRRLECECFSADLSTWAAPKVQSVLLVICVIPGTPSCTQAFGFCMVGFFWWVFSREILISLNKIRYSLVQQQNCVHDVLQWTKIWCYHRLEKSIMYAYFPSLKLKLLMWKMAENCLGVGGVQTGRSLWLKNVSLIFFPRRKFDLNKWYEVVCSYREGLKLLSLHITPTETLRGDFSGCGFCGGIFFSCLVIDSRLLSWMMISGVLLLWISKRHV